MRMLLLGFLFLLLSCNTIDVIDTQKGLVYPSPPLHPVLQNPECLSDEDLDTLATFLLEYRTFLVKHLLFKKELLS